MDVRLFSYSSKDVQLQNYQYTEQKFHPELSYTLLRWQMFDVVFSVDIKKMFP